MRSILAFFFISAFTCVVACGCSEKQSSTELVVSAAISMKECLTKIAKNFEQEHPGTIITFNFGASGQLEQQIEQGAPVDVFVSASVDQIQALEEKHLANAVNERTIAKNALVVVASNDATYKTLEDLSKASKIAIGNPATVPAGKYAQQTLKKCGLYNKMYAEHKLVFAENVRQVLSYVDSKDADAGFVYRTDAVLSKDSRICFSIPKQMSEHIEYSAIKIDQTQHPELAMQFIEYLGIDKNQAIMKQAGFEE